MPERPDPGLPAELVQVLLTVVAEGGMADVVTDGDRLDQVVVEPEPAADGPGDPREQLHVDDAVRDPLVAYQVEDLGLVDIGGVGLRVQDPVHIDGKRVPHVPGARVVGPASQCPDGIGAFHVTIRR